MNIQTIPTKQTRDHLSEIIDQVSIAEKSFIITRSGKQKAMLVPIHTSKSTLASTSQNQTLSKQLKPVLACGPIILKLMMQLSMYKNYANLTMKYLIDTTVFIRSFRGDQRAEDFLMAHSDS